MATTLTDDDDKTARRKVVRHLARALWSTEAAEDDADARKAAWQAARKERTAQARKLLRILEKRGVTVTAPADDDSDED